MKGYVNGWRDRDLISSLPKPKDDVIVICVSSYYSYTKYQPTDRYTISQNFCSITLYSPSLALRFFLIYAPFCRIWRQAHSNLSLKMATKIITAIFEATCTLEKLRNRIRYNEGHKILLSLIMHKLRGVRTFLLCLKKLRTTKVTRFTYPNVEERHESDHLETSVEEESQVESLLKRLECYVERIHTEATKISSLKFYYVMELINQNIFIRVLLDLQTTEEEIDQWYTSLSDYLPLASNPLAANEVEGIFDSVVENVGDFLSHHTAYVGVVVAPIEALKVNVTFWSYFLHCATFLGIDQQQEFQHLLRSMEALAFSAAHFTLHMFSEKHYNMEIVDGPDEISLTMNALYGPDSHETSYCRN